MATINNIFPLAQALRLSLVPYKSQLELNNSFRPGEVNEPFLGVLDFLAGIHGKELFISDPPKKGSGSQPSGGWNFRTVLGNNVMSPYYGNCGSRAFQLGNVVSTTPDEWIQLQGTIYGIYKMLDPISILNSGTFSEAEKKFWIDSLGLIKTPENRRLYGANGTLLVEQSYTDPIAYAKDWNNIKVPYDLSTGYNTPYVFGVIRIPKNQGDGFYVRSIGKIIVDQYAAIDYWNYYFPLVA